MRPTTPHNEKAPPPPPPHFFFLLAFNPPYLHGLIESRSITMTDFDHEAALRHRNKSALGHDNRVVNLEELNADDAELAAKFGYKPVLKREFTYLSTFSFAVSISGLFSTIATTFSYPLSAGGSASAVWCWLISGAGCMCIAVCIRPSRMNLICVKYAGNEGLTLLGGA